MTHQLIFRQASKKDVPDIVKMLSDDKLGAKRERFEEPLPQCYTDAFDVIANDPHQELTVVERNGEIIGTFQLTFIRYLTYQGGVRAQIEAVRVKSSYRGQGLGKEIFEYAIDRAREKGAHLVQLTTDKQRPEAIEFYRALGFIASHEGMKLHL